MITILRGDAVERGTWLLMRLAGRAMVLLACPVCGGAGRLQGGDEPDHEIAADGTVTPSVECPYRGCSFHDHVRLEGWEPTIDEPPPR